MLMQERQPIEPISSQSEEVAGDRLQRVGDEQLLADDHLLEPGIDGDRLGPGDRIGLRHVGIEPPRDFRVEVDRRHREQLCADDLLCKRLQRLPGLLRTGFLCDGAVKCAERGFDVMRCHGFPQADRRVVLFSTSSRE
uniref:hypothetical protein n=1 Tax=Neoaquamicrobium sediminum TaxID=1849104 RepID=UPI001FD0C3B9|nr:hypothetical protein [Mesorhizobium sediminum]